MKGGKEKPSFIQRLRNRGETPNARSSSHPGTNCGKATSMPVHNPQSWRNPGGPIRTPAGYETSYAAAKPYNAGKHKGANGRAGCNVRHQHPYNKHPNNKHAQKESVDGCPPPRKELLPRPSLQRTNVQRTDPAKQESSGNDIHRKSDKTNKRHSQPRSAGTRRKI